MPLIREIVQQALATGYLTVTSFYRFGIVDALLLSKVRGIP
jgi:hypothetical protein